MSELQKNRFIDLIDRDDYEGSLEKLAKTLKQGSLSEKNKLKILEAKAECLQGMDKLNEAETLYKDILAQDEKYYRAYYGLDLLYQTWTIKTMYEEENEDYEQKRIDLWKKLESIAPDQVSYLMLSSAYDYKDMYNEALKYYKKALGKEEYLWTKSDICASMGSIYFIQGKYKKSLDAYDKAVVFSKEEWGDTHSCEDYFAVMREIYRRMPGDNEENILEMERLYEDSKKLRKAFSNNGKGASGKYKELIEKIKKIKLPEEAVKKEKELKERVVGLIREGIEESESLNINNIDDVEELVDVFVEEYFEDEAYKANIEEKFSYKMDLILLIQNNKLVDL